MTNKKQRLRDLKEQEELAKVSKTIEKGFGEESPLEKELEFNREKGELDLKGKKNDQ